MGASNADYERQFKEIVAKAKAVYGTGAYDDSTLELLIPGLRESEDERIRKLLVWQVHRNIEDDTNDLAQSVYDGIKGHDPDLEESIEDWKKCLVWLEKQKENPKSANSIPSDCASDVKYEDRWHKVTDSLPDNGRLVLAKDCLGNVLLARYDGENWEVNVYDNEDHYCHNSISKWCEIPSEKQKDSKVCEEKSKNFTIQKEQKPAEVKDPFSNANFVRGYESGYADAKREQRPIQTSEEKEYIRTLKSLISDFIRDKQPEDVAFYQKIYDWLEERHIEQKPKEHLPKEKVFDIMRNLTALSYSERIPINSDEYGWIHKITEDVRSLLDYPIEQKPAEWSEEDENKIESIKGLITMGRFADTNTIRTIWELLESLRPSWKPSEEQMGALSWMLENARGNIDFDPLKDLYEQLKKLM